MARTRKQPYRKSRAFDSSCRSHGGCPWCLGSRRHATAKRRLATVDSMLEWLDDLRRVNSAALHGRRTTELL